MKSSGDRVQPPASVAAGAGVESPTVLLESEDRLSERTALLMSHPGSCRQDVAIDALCLKTSVCGVGGVFCQNPPSPTVITLEKT